MNIVKLSKNLFFLLILAQQIKIYFVQVFKLIFYETAIIFLWFSEVLAIYLEAKSLSVMKTVDFRKHLLTIFEKTYDSLYICHFLWLQQVCITSNDNLAISQFCTLQPKRILKNPTKMLCAELSAVWRHLSGRSFYIHLYS